MISPKRKILLLSAPRGEEMSAIILASDRTWLSCPRKYWGTQTLAKGQRPPEALPFSLGRVL